MYIGKDVSIYKSINEFYDDDKRCIDKFEKGNLKFVREKIKFNILSIWSLNDWIDYF